MAIVTVDGIHAERAPKRGVFAEFLEAIAEAQMQRARAIAKPHLLAMDDDELRKVGYSREEIRRWPSGARWL